MAGRRDRARFATAFALVMACALVCAGGLALAHPACALGVAPATAADDLPLRDDEVADGEGAPSPSDDAAGAEDGAQPVADESSHPAAQGEDGDLAAGDGASDAAPDNSDADSEEGAEGAGDEGADATSADSPQRPTGTVIELDPDLTEDNLVNPQQLPDSSFIYDTSIIDLSTADAYIDGQTVQVVGEAIGDNLRATFGGRQRWITLSSSDDSSTIAVIMSAESASRIDTFGAYNVRGTIVQVRGIFNLVCAEHEGVSDLHAEVVNIVEKGVRTEDPFELESFLPGAATVAVGLLMMGLFYFLRERRR